MNDDLGMILHTDQMPVSENGDYTPVPIAFYDFIIEKASVKDTKAGTGKYINVGFKITGPAYEGRYIFKNYNIVNPDEKTQANGLADLRRLLEALKMTQLSKASNLLGMRLSGKVNIRKGKDKEGNEIEENTLGKYGPPGAGNIVAKPTVKMEDDDLPF